MRKYSEFVPINKVLVPLVHKGPGIQALEFARCLDANITLVGVVVVPPNESLSVGATAARELRKQLRQYGKDPHITGKAQIIVSYQPWRELAKLVQNEQPDLLCLEWHAHFRALRLTASEVLARPPCNVALMRGKLTRQPNQVLVPVRGGPHAELALRVGLGLRPKGVTALHLRHPDDPQAGSDAPFKGLERVLKQMPDVHKQFAVTDDAAQLILDNASKADVIIVGTTAQPVTSSASLGPFADRILHEASVPVIAVKSGRPLPQSDYDERAGTQAISILVDKWFAENTFHADEFKQLDELLKLKRQQGVIISAALPALNEEESVGNVLKTIKNKLMEEVPLLDEMVLIDSKSTDRTREIAEDLGVNVRIHQEILPQYGERTGKGEALWKSLYCTQGDIIIWLDTDIVNIHPRFVYGLIAPMLLRPEIHFVKGFYRRPLKVGNKIQAGGGGRVTELTARPLLNLFYPELSGIIQPLSGEYGGRRKALETLPFFSGYGVEIGLLIDLFETFGLSAIAQVDLQERVHHNQTLEALSKMSFAIIQAVIRKLEKRYSQRFLENVNKTMKLIRYERERFFLDVEEIAEGERPPMLEVREYMEKFGKREVEKESINPH